MSYEVKIEVFEGPLDLLLQLITSKQVSITEVSLTELVSEYISYLDVMRSLDLDVTSEFLLIASTLIQMKARHLLPDDAEIDLDEELELAEERDRLLTRLLACLTFKDVAAVLSHRIQSSLRFVPRMAGLDSDIAPMPPALDLRISPIELCDIAHHVLTRGPLEPELDHLDMDLPSVEDAMADVRVRMSGAIESTFDELVAHCERDIDVVAYFLAVLELARWGVVSVAQATRDEPILLKGRQDIGHFDLASEWA